ncbi:hypothetical protein [Echinimonas agarilytica]|uniref:Lysozyme inhibitor LprI N-terminal domain-containing protein n=1 Tax=Echinimonas agarilytica TaxID=1215918 RepID=A0AA41W4K6_9GAMM|nr:hypothetical protein [Echinimonas agarilytica]MCM2678539.1 hypothetical protein [Echinimonas agarilytica]
MKQLLCLSAVAAIGFSSTTFLVESKPYPTTDRMDRKCLYLARQMNDIHYKLTKQRIDKALLKADLIKYEKQWLAHECYQGGKNVR